MDMIDQDGLYEKLKMELWNDTISSSCPFSGSPKVPLAKRNKSEDDFERRILPL
jgi:hypothetical protein